MSNFSERLVALGFSSYAQYLDSQHWKNFKARYKASGNPMTCSVCGSRRVQLHHHTYRRLGNEEFGDVTPLCRAHHVAVHEWLVSSGFLFVSYTREAIAVLQGSQTPSPRKKRPIGLIIRDRVRLSKKEKKRRKELERRKKLNLAKQAEKINSATGFWNLHPIPLAELKELTKDGFLTHGQYQAAFWSLSLEKSYQFIAKGRIKKSSKMAQKKAEVVKHRVSNAFSSNAKSQPQSDSSKWKEFLNRVRKSKFSS